MNDYWKTIPSPDLFDFEEFYARIAQELPDNSRIVEAGLANGRSMIYLAAHLQSLGKTFRLVGIDNMAYGGQEQRNTLISNIIAAGIPGIELLEMSSLDASCKFPDGYFDFVFLDSSHLEDQTRAEILLWSRKVIDFGILAGHDVITAEPVRKAVNETIPADQITIEPTRLGFGVWWMRKPHVPKPASQAAAENP